MPVHHGDDTWNNSLADLSHAQHLQGHLVFFFPNGEKKGKNSSSERKERSRSLTTSLICPVLLHPVSGTFLMRQKYAVAYVCPKDEEQQGLMLFLLFLQPTGCERALAVYAPWLSPAWELNL